MWAVIYKYNDNYYTAKYAAHQRGEAFNYAREDASERFHCNPLDIEICSVIEMF